jgi:4-amino-4-deoxy-L-arabinose transferase-like glycosyltransferase
MIMAVAVILRLGVALYLGNDLGDPQQERVFDQISYDGLARRVLEGHGFSMGVDWWPLTQANAPTAHWSYLYTLYLAAVYAIFGFNPLAARFIQVLIVGALTPWLLYLLGKQAFNPRVGLIAAAICAVYSYFIFYSASLMTESFYILAILSSLYLAGRIGLAQRPRYWEWILLGAAMAIAVLLRQVFLFILPVIGLWLMYSGGKNWLRAAYGFSLSVLIVILTILPWTVRNYLAFHQFVLLNTNAGYAFFWANHPIHGTNFIVLLPPEISYTSLIPPELHGLDEAALEKALMQRGVQFVLADPVRYILLSLSRIKDQFFFWPSPKSDLLSNLSRLFSFGILLPFMIYGIIAAIRMPPPGGDQPNRPARFAAWLKTPVALWLALFLVYTALHLASWASIRYRLPTDAVAVLFAGLAIASLIPKLLPTRTHKAVLGHDPGVVGH